MKIVLDFRKYDGVVGGVEQGAIQMTKYLASNGGHVVLVCKESQEEKVREIFTELDAITIVTLPINSHSISISNAKIDSGFLQDLAEKENADLIHFFYNWSFPFKKKVPSVLTVHDVIPFTFREAMNFYRNHFIYKPAIRTACRLNDIITTVSEYSRQDISKRTGAPLDKIHVVSNGLRVPKKPSPEAVDALTAKLDIKDGCVLNVGGIHERKNIARLVQSFANLVNKHNYKGKLVITGSVSGPPYQEKMKKQCDKVIAATKMQDRVVFTGFISEEELDILLEIAEIFIYPSLYEGFGIPIIESMLMGTPVITSNVTAMPGVAGDAGILVDPYSVDNMTSEMNRLLKDDKLRAELIQKGKERASAYSWDTACKQYLDVYEKALKKG